MADTQGQASHWSIGDVIADRYVIEGVIGEGGFGKVYRARQRGTEQAVAIKRLRLVTGPGAPPVERQRERFRREIRLCGRLFHPNVVRLIDAGERGDEPYTVFEFVPGRDLATILAEEGRLSLAETLHLMTQVLDGLAAAHAAGVIHRDLKPHNIMVTEAGARRNAIVLDFGTGALADGAGDGARLTGSLEMLGTPAYAAPEQLRGLPPTPRADLYAWGLIVVECLTGSRVVGGASVHETLYNQLSDAPISIPPALRGQPLGHLLARVLDKDVERRDVRAAELVTALGALAGPTRAERPAAAAEEDEPLAPGQVATLAAPVDPSDWHTGGGDRRQIIAIVCALTLDPADGQALDPEVVDQLTRQQLAACAEDVAPTGARLAGALGAGLLWYVGLPHAREDDGRRAARAARALRDGLATRAATLRASYGVRLVGRVGVHAGRQVVTAGAVEGPHPDALGPLAAQTLALAVGAEAEAGAVTISEGARRLLDAASLPDAADPARADTLERPRLSPLVGRDRELETLDALWARARDGQGQAALLIGEAGIGKSRLLHAIRGRVGGATWLSTRCLPEARNSALRPLTELVDGLLDALVDRPDGDADGGADEGAARVEALHRFVVARGLDAAEAMPLLGALVGLPVGEAWPQPPMPPPRRRERTFDLLLQCLFDLADDRPLVLAVEDLHWCDPSTLEFLKLLVEDAPAAPLLVVLTTRPGLSPPWSPGRVEQLRLERLDAEAVAALVAACDAGHALTDSLRGQIATRTDGVPLFVEELTRMLTDARRGGDERAVPDTLQASLTARLDALGPARRTAQVAAAIGREFREDLLGHVAGREPDALRADLRALIDAALVYRRRRGRATYVFKHALVRDTAYDALTGPARAALHGQIGEAIEAHLPDVAERRPELLAHHFGRAGDRRRATVYGEKAANDALHRSANIEAISHARQAIEWLEGFGDARERLERELRLTGLMTPALMAAKGFVAPDVRQSIDRATALLAEVGDITPWLPIVWSTAMVHNVLGDRPEARTLMQRVVDHAEQKGDDANLIAGLPMLAGFWMMEGAHPEALAIYDRALAHYDRATHRALAPVYGWDPAVTADIGSAIAVWATGRIDEAFARSARGEVWARELNHTHSVAQALMYRANLGFYAGDRAHCRAQATAGVEYCKAHEMPDNLAYIEVLRGWAADDIDACRAALDMCEASGLRLGMSVFPVALALLEVEHGLDAGVARLEGCVDFAVTTGEGFLLPWIHGHLGDALAPRDLDRARAQWQTALELADRGATPTLGLRPALSLARDHVERGEPRRAVDLLAPRLAAISGGRDLPDVRDGRALLAALDPDALKEPPP